jgi:hypothetical protein
MTPEREAEVRDYIARHRHKVGAHRPLGFSTAVGAAADLLDALDATRAREARLREAARVVGHIAVVPYTDAANEAKRNLDAALADPTATTWLADRERDAAVRALRWAARLDWAGMTDDELSERADAIEAGEEPTP